MILGKDVLMVIVLIMMFAILVVAGAVVLYVAYPHRGEEVPGAPWLGEAMKRGVDALPTLEPLDPDLEDEPTHRQQSEHSHR